MQKALSDLIYYGVIIAGFVLPSLLFVQYASSIVTEEELVARQLAEVSAEEKAMDELTWINYTNSEFGFSIEYPESFVPPILQPAGWSEGDMTIPTAAYGFLFNNYKTAETSLLPSFSATLDVYLADSFDKTLRQFMYEDFFGTIRTPVQQPIETTIAGNTSGLEFMSKGIIGEPGKFVGFVHGKYLYVFGSEDLDSQNRQLLNDHMLSSIKFVNIVDSDDNDQSDSNDENVEDNEESDDRDNNNYQDDDDNN